MLLQVTAVCFNDTGDQVISGGLDNNLKVPTKTMSNQTRVPFLSKSIIVRDLARLLIRLMFTDIMNFDTNGSPY